jgi:hypothetical protein
MHKPAEQCEIKASTLPGLICTAHLIIFTFQYEIINGKIATLVPKLFMKGQLRPSTFKVVNLVPQFSFLGQIRPCLDDHALY